MICPQCGKEFEQKTVVQKYCSKKCREKYCRTHNMDAEYPSITFTCAMCGETVTTSGKASDKRTKFCSHDCEKRYWRYMSNQKHERKPPDPLQEEPFEEPPEIGGVDGHVRKTLYMQVSQDEYEFPEIICDNLDELARKAGVSKRAIEVHINRVKKGWCRNPRYRAVQYNDWESDEDW